MAIVQTITVTATQGQDNLTKSVYVSGDAKDIRSIDTLYSGIQSGISFETTLNGLKSIYINCNQNNSRVKAYGLSGEASFDMQANVPLIWWSGCHHANPFAIASGNITGMSYQQLSGFVSGTLSIQMIKDATP